VPLAEFRPHRSDMPEWRRTRPDPPATSIGDDQATADRPVAMGPKSVPP